MIKGHVIEIRETILSFIVTEKKERQVQPKKIVFEKSHLKPLYISAKL